LNLNACGIYGTVGGGVVGYILHALLRFESKFRQRLLLCSPGAHPLGFLLRRVSGEERGGATEILSRTEVEHGECTQSTDLAAARSPPSRDVG
jgi:hypothetical protein